MEKTSETESKAGKGQKFMGKQGSLALRDSRGCQDGFRFMLMNMMLGWVEIIRGRSPLSGGVN